MTDVRRHQEPAMTQPPRRRVAGQRSRSKPPTPANRPAARPAPARPAPPPTASRSTPPPSAVASTSVTGKPEIRQDGGQPAGRRGPRTWLLAVLAALLIAIMVVIGLLVAAQRRAATVEQASGEAVRAARTAATKVLSYNYQHLDADFAAGRALTTKPFSDQYAKTTGTAVKQVATKTKATVTAQVASAGVERAGADEVVVLLFVDQTTTSSRLERPQVDQNRVEMTMTKVGDRWLVSQVRGL